MTAPLTFTPGKFYKTRDGRHKIEVIVAGRNFACGHSIMGLRTSDVGVHIPSTFTANGRLYKDSESPADLIAEWSDAPEFDWSKLPMAANWAALNSEGKGFAYTHKPLPMNCYACYEGRCWELYPEHTPTWSGDWRDSLVTRPTEGGK